MTGWRPWMARLRELFVGRSIDRDLTEEVHSHLDHLTDEFMRRGFTRDAARQRATREFGSIDQTKEAIRDTRGIPMLEHLVVDIRRAVRSLAKARTFTTVAVITLALGIGVNVAIFSVLDAVVLRPLPYPRADRLVSIYEVNVGAGPARASTSGSVIGGGGGDDPGRTIVAPANYVDYQARTKEFSSMAGLNQLTMTVTGSGAPEQVIGEEVTPNYFGVLEATPALGRLLSAGDARPGAPLALLCHFHSL